MLGGIIIKPIIGIVARPSILSQREVYYINKEVNDAILKNQGIAIIIPPPTTEKLTDKTLETTNKLTHSQFEEIKRLVNLCDGIICPGGNEFYDYDLRIIKYCYQTNKPLLGICLGMQAMGYLFNGKIQDLNNLSHKSEQKYVHKVKINKNSKIYEILQSTKIVVNSRHKSFVDDTELDCVGISDNNIIEAIEDKNKNFFIGVQWHPESMIKYDETANNLFKAFIDSCRK